MNSTKFILAAFIQFVSAVGLFIGKIDGGTWVAVSTITLGIYGVANVAAQQVAKPATATQ